MRRNQSEEYGHRALDRELRPTTKRICDLDRSTPSENVGGSNKSGLNPLGLNLDGKPHFYDHEITWDGNSIIQENDEDRKPKPEEEHRSPMKQKDRLGKANEMTSYLIQRGWDGLHADRILERG